MGSKFSPKAISSDVLPKFFVHCLLPLESYFHIDENPLNGNIDEEDKVFILARLYRNKVRAMDIITDYGSQSLQYLYP